MTTDLDKRSRSTSSSKNKSDYQLYSTAKYITLNNNDYELALSRQTDLFSSTSFKVKNNDTALIQFKNEKRVQRTIHMVCCLLLRL